MNDIIAFGKKYGRNKFWDIAFKRDDFQKYLQTAPLSEIVDFALCVQDKNICSRIFQHDDVVTYFETDLSSKEIFELLTWPENAFVENIASQRSDFQEYIENIPVQEAIVFVKKHYKNYFLVEKLFQREDIAQEVYA